MKNLSTLFHKNQGFIGFMLMWSAWMYLVFLTETLPRTIEMIGIPVLIIGGLVLWVTSDLINKQIP